MAERRSTSSILFEDPAALDVFDSAPEPDIFVDANLDQVVAAICATRPDYHLEPYFSVPLHTEVAVVYRQQVLRDLTRPEIGACASQFAVAMQAVRARQKQAASLHYRFQREWWELAAVIDYCRAVETFAHALQAATPDSVGLRRGAEYLAGYLASAPVQTMWRDAADTLTALAAVAYRVRIHGATVTVAPYDDEVDYSAEVLATFDRFRQRDAASHLVKFADHLAIDHVEAQVLDRVALLNPEVFEALDRHATDYADCIDPTVANLERETQFYLAYLDYIAPLQHAGLAVTLPSVSATDRSLLATDTFDIALAELRVGESKPVVTNDMALAGQERIIVISGPNQGGKTTFARTFAQIHYLASLGLSVPGSNVRTFLPDRIFTHFERGENLTDHRSKLEDELIRIHSILASATADSVIVINEIFSSTTLDDAIFLGTKVVRAIVDKGCLCLCVTFIDELAALDGSIVSMMSTVVPDNPAERTFKVVRHPADGLAYAAAIAKKYGLDYQRLKERVTS